MKDTFEIELGAWTKNEGARRESSREEPSNITCSNVSF